MNLTERMNFAESIRGELASQMEEQKKTDPAVQNPVEGYPMYLAAGAIPSLETVSFCNIIDVADAKRLLGIDPNNNDGDAIKDMGNECYVVERNTKSATPLPEGADEASI